MRQLLSLAQILGRESSYIIREQPNTDRGSEGYYTAKVVEYSLIILAIHFLNFKNEGVDSLCFEKRRTSSKAELLKYACQMNLELSQCQG